MSEPLLRESNCETTTGEPTLRRCHGILIVSLRLMNVISWLPPKPGRWSAITKSRIVSPPRSASDEFCCFHRSSMRAISAVDSIANHEAISTDEYGTIIELQKRDDYVAKTQRKPSSFAIANHQMVLLPIFRTLAPQSSGAFFRGLSTRTFPRMGFVFSSPIGLFIHATTALSQKLF